MTVENNQVALLPQNIKNFKVLKKIDPNADIKKAIWLYFLLIIFEGAIRKWVLPGFATPLLIIRDPVAFYILFKAIQKNLLINTPQLFWMMIIGFFGVVTAMLFGHGNFIVAIFGARILLLHFPVIYIMGRVMRPEDVKKMGVIFMTIMIPMTLIVALQFFSPQSTWINRGIGGDLAGGGYNGGANGFLRPPGTFSFTTGLGQFYGLGGCFVFYYLLNPKEINKLILLAATVSFLAAIPLCISRSVLIQAGLSLIFALVGAVRNPKLIGTTIGATMMLVIVFFALQRVTFFTTASNAFQTRIEAASGSEKEVNTQAIDRYLGGMIEALGNINSTGFWGLGLGMGSNVGSQLLEGKVTFLITEAELGRWIGELGPIMGLAVIFIRLKLALNMLATSFKRLKTGDLLPWILMSFGFVGISQGNWSQPTSLGFCILAGGFIAASSELLGKQVQPKKVVNNQRRFTKA